MSIRLKTPSEKLRSRTPSAGILAGGVGGSGAVSSIKTIVTEASTTPSATKMNLTGTQNAVRVWTGEQAVTEESFFLYFSVNGGTVKKVRCYRWQGTIINAATSATIAIGTSDGRTLKFSAMTVPAALETISGATGTALADEGVAGFWTPSAPHITLTSNNSAFILESSGTERTVFMSEHDGSAWTPTTFVVVPASTDIKVRCTYKKIALATLDASTVDITAPTGALIGGASTTMAFSQTATGTTYNVTSGSESDFRAKCALAVAGDEIVIPSGGGFTLTANITDATFAANELAGRQGAEGIIIRGSTGVASDVTIVLNDDINGWRLGQVGATQYTLVKGITFNLAGRAAFVNNVGGKFRYQDCRITGNSTSTTSPSFSMDASLGAITLDALRVLADDGVEDLFDGNGTGSDSGTTSVIRLIKCIGFDSGTTSDNQQVITTHNGQRIQVYGGYFYDARLSVVACDSNAASVVHMFFSTTSDGAAGRRGALSDISGFFISNDSSASVDSVLPDPGCYLVGCNITRDGLGSGSSVIRYAAGDLPANDTVISNRISINNGRAIFPSVGGGTYMFNILSSTSGEGLRINNYVATSSTANTNVYNNTFKNSTIALSYGDVNLPSVLRNNACTTNSNSISGVTAPIDATIDGDYNVLDPAISAAYTAGANDTTGSNAALDSNDFPTDGGNCDSNGETTTFDWVGGIDCCGLTLIYKVNTISRGARTIPEIVSGADVFPNFWV